MLCSLSTLGTLYLYQISIKITKCSEEYEAHIGQHDSLQSSVYATVIRTRARSLEEWVEYTGLLYTSALAWNH